MRIIDGSRPSRHGNTPPQPATVMPTPPAHLGVIAKTEWKRIARELFDLGLLTRVDRVVLAAYCASYERWRQAEEALARLAAKDTLTHGMVLKTTSGNLIQSPLVGVANRSMLLMVRFAAELGMTPSARLSMNVRPGDGGGDGSVRDKYGF